MKWKAVKKDTFSCERHSVKEFIVNYLSFLIPVTVTSPIAKPAVVVDGEDDSRLEACERIGSSRSVDRLFRLGVRS